MGVGKGFIPLDREILTSQKMFNERPYCKLGAWVDLNQRAAHSPHTVTFQGENYDLKPGELVTSLRILALRWGWNKNKVERFLERLAAGQLVGQEVGQRVRRLTIENLSQKELRRDSERDNLRDNLRDTREESNKDKNELREILPGKKNRGRTLEQRLEGTKQHQKHEFIYMAPDDYRKLVAKEGKHRLEVALELLNGWIRKKRGQLKWFLKTYESAYTYLIARDCWVWEKVPPKPEPVKRYGAYKVFKSNDPQSTKKDLTSAQDVVSRLRQEQKIP